MKTRSLNVTLYISEISATLIPLSGWRGVCIFSGKQPYIFHKFWIAIWTVDTDVHLFNCYILYSTLTDIYLIWKKKQKKLQRWALAIFYQFKVSELKCWFAISRYFCIFAILLLFYFWVYCMSNVLVLWYLENLSGWCSGTFTASLRYRYFCDKYPHFCIAIQMGPSMKTYNNIFCKNWIYYDVNLVVRNKCRV